MQMKVMVMVKASKHSEAGMMPSEQLLAEMGKFNEELAKAGVLVDAAGLQPTSKGKRVRFAGATRTVIDGPFTETKELLAGYWIWEVKSMEEALEWIKRCPNPQLEGGDIEIRALLTPEDFATCDPTGEHRAAVERLRDQAAKR
jgi:hypothetical protein